MADSEPESPRTSFDEDDESPRTSFDEDDKRPYVTAYGYVTAYVEVNSNFAFWKRLY
ncbi:hypothetical protein PFICI_00400 [Pestalotiopsis fici W106-1]|uniref:Uncharacterized protein n=1 Tax=Pestalotiopsis fici (strain W106-1 / CGMCC3.15140) TaxID=1229662 RepID=W3XM59_PESFW|nr:uncharacterized protein PFICI_00400 [Pestalotiopsis fici W106-1]ETS86572.1 hypothetical protein PFICI_00400 [Pestalotiopsis fici W106-1]